MPARWDSDAKFKLLLAMYQVKNPSPPDWDQVAKLLGPNVTAEACRQQFKAIKKAAGKELSLEASSTANAANGTPNGSRKRKGGQLDGQDDDEDAAPSPSKKRSSTKKSGGIVKKEPTVEPKIKVEEYNLDGACDMEEA